MLKIRGKLILSFSVVMVILLSALGAITYYTFKDSIKSNKEEISVLLLKNHNLEFEAIIEKMRYEIRDLADSVQLLEDKLSKTRLEKILQSHVKVNPFIESVVIFDEQGMPFSDVRNEQSQKLIEFFNANDNKQLPEISLIDKSLWISRKSTNLDNQTRHLFYLLDLPAIWQTIIAGNKREPGSLLLVSEGNEVILSHYEKPEEEDESLPRLTHLIKDKSSLVRIAKEVDQRYDELVLVDSNYVLANQIDVLDWRIYSIISQEKFIADLIKLKNRVIATTVVTLWVSIWIVLIVAHRIAKPISALSEATKAIQKFNYSKPLVMGNRQDEIGELAHSFETMRLHIQGLVFRDTLTGIYNRRYLMHTMGIEISKVKRDDNSISFVMLDLDHFKQVNDTYGHSGGDEVLKAAAKAIESSVRDYDIPARYGGEEFSVVLPMANAQEAQIVAERIREKVEDLLIHFEGQDIKVTCSLGIATITDIEDYKNKSKTEITNQLMAFADQALYFAKNSGRNRSVIYKPELAALEAGK